MEILPTHQIFFCLFVILLNSVYTSQQQYFVNCGSSSTTTVNNRDFIGDVNSRSFTLSGPQITTAQNPNTSAVSSSLYDTARIFRRLSWYEFEIVQNGTYVVRFHFSAFPSQLNFSAAQFDVLASGFSLLSNFTAQSSSNSPIIEEFLLTVNQGKFRIYFVPSQSSSFAFINGIEAFVNPSTPPNSLIPDSARQVTPAGSRNNDYQGLLSNALRVIYRINVGGSAVTADVDPLWRNWVPDDDFLLFPGVAVNAPFRSALPSYKPGFATRFDAPDPVYNTAKELNINSTSNVFNISWRFRVNRNDAFLVRAHFCDIISSVFTDILRFSFYIYSNFSDMVDPHDPIIPQLAVPFFRDFVVDSDGSGFMNISVGPMGSSPLNQTAFLNGLEIMKLITNSSSFPDGSEPTRNQLFVIIGSVVGGSVFIIILVVIFVFIKRRKPKAGENSDVPTMQVYGGSSYGQNMHGSPLADLNLGLKLPLSDILWATKNFDGNLIIGEGGFGKVYKGILQNGTKVAVKRSEPGRGQGLSEFQTEIMVLSKIRHRHLVSLIGYCDERSEMILVYEFMEKGTLRDHVRNFRVESTRPTTEGTLSWDKRLQLCIDAAKGLHYLHTGLNGAIIHRDVKSTNILLDDQYVAKVADFGISHLGSLDQTHVSTEVKGSFGYLDPEYFKCLQLTQKSDVYSFGVVLLEVLCARDAIDNSLPREQASLAEWGLCCIMSRELEKLVDPSLVGKINPSSLRKFGETVQKCLQEYGVDRPNMFDVLWDLEYALQLQHTPLSKRQHEDSEIDVSLDLSLPGIHRLPSHSIPISEYETPTNDYSLTSYTSDTSVFSQLKIDGAR